MPKIENPFVLSRRSASLMMLGAGATSLAGCVGAPTTRLGMVKNPDTGLMIGSTVSNTLITDASFYRNRKMKVRIRNTSGDTAFDLYNFQKQIEQSFANNGYEPTQEDDFGLLLDLNVRYSGHIQTNMAAEYGFLGLAGGTLAGTRQSGTATGAGIGAVSGAAIGSIIGSFVTDDTYIIIANSSFVKTRFNSKGRRKTITLSGSQQYIDQDDTTENGIVQMTPIEIAVYAGGRNTPQSEIAGMVRERMVRIVGDMI